MLPRATDRRLRIEERGHPMASIERSGRRTFAGPPVRSLLLPAAAAVLAVAAVDPLLGQDAPGGDAWFGLPLPPGLEPHAPAAVIGDRGPVPAAVPPGEESYRELEGGRIRRDLDTIVGFSRQSRERREIGEGRLWGRITGFPSSARTVRWATEELEAAGVPDVQIQRFRQEEDASFWLPLSWEVRLLGDPAFGEGSRDVVLESAMPLPPSEIADGELTAPLVQVGTARPAQLEEIDVRGKIAVQHVVPRAHTYFERSETESRARDLFERGAVAVISVLEQPGNERARDFDDCGGPCFNLGGRDGHFLEAVMDSAAEAGRLGRLRARIELETGRRSGLTGLNGIATVPGSGAGNEHIVVDAHADAWFDGAGDNGDGLAVTMALARHFAKPEHRPRRTLVFVISGGHHSPGLDGPERFVEANPEIAANTVLVLNVEHVAQRNLTLARRTFEDGYRKFIADGGEAPVVAGITNRAPFLERLVRRGVERYGVNFVSEESDMSSGESGGFRPLGVPLVTIMQANPLYHTSGEVAEVISTPGLERMARFLAFFIREVDRAPRHRIDP